jgi:hypothetical protein
VTCIGLRQRGVSHHLIQKHRSQRTTAQPVSYQSGVHARAHGEQRVARVSPPEFNLRARTIGAV